VRRDEIGRGMALKQYALDTVDLSTPTFMSIRREAVRQLAEDARLRGPDAKRRFVIGLLEGVLVGTKLSEKAEFLLELAKDVLIDDED
jgi:hypothetical protein